MSKRSKTNRKQKKGTIVMSHHYTGNHVSTPTTPTTVLLEADEEPRVKYNGKVYHKIEEDGFVGYKEEPQEAIIERVPKNKWKGAKIPWPVLNTIKAFFEWSQAETHSEVTCRLFHNPTTGEWKPWAFPQERGGGMSAKELPDHPQRPIQRNALGLGFLDYGTIHHHCTGGAFQSSTDRNDEVNLTGIHFTLGGISTARYSVDVRCIIGNLQTPIDLSDMFELDELAMSVIPVDMWDEVIKRRVCTPPPPGTPFPDVWKTNLVARTYSTPGAGFNHTGHQYVGGLKGFSGPEGAFRNRMGEPLNEDAFKADFWELCQAWEMDKNWVIQWLVKQNYSEVPVLWCQSSSYAPPPPFPKANGATSQPTKAEMNEALAGMDDEDEHTMTQWEAQMRAEGRFID